MAKQQALPRRESKLREKLRRAAIRVARLWYWNALLGIIAGILIALLLSQGISILEMVITRTGIKSLLSLRTFGLMVVFVTTNLVAIVRTYNEPLDPQLDLRYYSRVWTKLGGGKDSEFLAQFYRVSCPFELTYSDRVVVTRIESHIPFTLLFTGVSSVFLALLGVAMWTEVVADGLGLDTLVALLVSIGLFSYLAYTFVIEGFRDDLRSYTLWKGFWVGYWYYVLDMLEADRRVDIAMTGVGSWSGFVGWRWVGQHMEYSNQKFLEDLKKKATKMMKKKGISDLLPTETLNLFQYIDRLVLYSDLRLVVDESGKTPKALLEQVPDLRDAIKYLNEVHSLDNDFVMPCLKECRRILRILPIGELSTEAAQETLILDPPLAEDAAEIREMAEARLEHLSSLSNHPVPESVKWIGVTYAATSLIMTWLASLGVS